MRLVDQNKLALDEDVNAKLTSWKANGFDKNHPVTLRGLLSMTAGIGVPGFLGYAVGAPLPNLTQILYGEPPANSPPVTVIAQPGGSFAYSGGGYEIAEALMGDTVKAPFPKAMAELVLKPAGMAHSSFAQPLPQDWEEQAVKGHDANGREMAGGWHVFPEHAAAGSGHPTDLAAPAGLPSWRGQSSLFLLPETAARCSSPRTAAPWPRCGDRRGGWLD